MAQPESKLSHAIMGAMRARGAFVHKNHGGPTMMNGLPDIEGVYCGRYVAVETKMPDGGDPTPIQRLRHAQIREAGGTVIVARSVDDVTAWLARIDGGTPRTTPTDPRRAKTPPRPTGRAGRRLSPVCAIPDCGCSGLAHP